MADQQENVKNVRIETVVPAQKRAQISVMNLYAIKAMVQSLAKTERTFQAAQSVQQIVFHATKITNFAMKTNAKKDTSRFTIRTEK